jgi:hypothetical protein
MLRNYPAQDDEGRPGSFARPRSKTAEWIAPMNSLGAERFAARYALTILALDAAGVALQPKMIEPRETSSGSATDHSTTGPLYCVAARSSPKIM